YGPDRAMRYNGYPAAEINGGPAPGFSSGQAEALIAKLANENLPKGLAFEWTDLTYQRILAGNTAIFVYPLCLLLVFLVLAAQYESLRLPLAIILIVPLCLLFAITGVWLKGGDNNIFTQIGLIVLVGLACMNAILIVEFAKHKQDEEGLSPIAAGVDPALPKSPAGMPTLPGTAAAAIALLLTATSVMAGPLTVGPDYKRPTNAAPSSFKAADLGEWKEGRPLDNVPNGNWWKVFGDSALNDLESRAAQANQDLKAAVARVDQSR